MIERIDTAFRWIGHDRIQCVECGTTFIQTGQTLRKDDWRYCPYCRRRIVWKEPPPRV